MAPQNVRMSIPLPADRVALALAHMEAHLDQPLTALRLAAVAGVSPHHFHRLFQARRGCSVGQHLTQRRLQRACALLVSGDEPVLEVALAVGYESAQALAKAMRRNLFTTPTAVRQGRVRPTFAAPSLPTVAGSFTMLEPRFVDLPQGLVALTATARGMVDRHMSRAARQAIGELLAAVQQAGLATRIRSRIAFSPDDAQGPDDPDCRYVAGVLFGHRLADGSGHADQPAVPLAGTLAWQPLAVGRHAVFTHIGPYADLHRAWQAIYRDWLPASGESLQDAAPMELMLNSPADTPPERLHTEIWLPLQPR